MKEFQEKLDQLLEEYYLLPLLGLTVIVIVTLITCLFKSFWEPEKYLPSLVLSSAALIAILAYWRERKHNKLSVEPHLSFDVRRSKWDKCSIVLVNRGIGPAKIVDLCISFDGNNERKKEKDDNGFNYVQDKLISEDLTIDDITGIMLGPNDAILPGEEFELLKVNKNNYPDPNNILPVLTMGTLIPRLEFNVVYSSFYNNETKSCTWKGEHTSFPIEQAKRKLAEIKNN